MRTFYFLALLLLTGCANNDAVTDTAADSTVIVSYDTIPVTRANVHSAPVATYSEKIADELNDWQFAVTVYETKKTFQYTIRIQAKEARVSDSLSIPNFGIQPTVAIQKGKEPLSCIIGFLDKKKEFKPYKMVSFQNDRLRVRTIASYYVGAYKTQQRN